jgi:hypothetical protein
MKKRIKSRKRQATRTSTTGATGEVYPHIIYAPPIENLDEVCTTPAGIPNLSGVECVDANADPKSDADSCIYEIGVYKLVGVQQFKVTVPPRPPSKVTRVK